LERPRPIPDAPVLPIADGYRSRAPPTGPRPRPLAQQKGTFSAFRPPRRPRRGNRSAGVGCLACRLSDGARVLPASRKRGNAGEPASEGPFRERASSRARHGVGGWRGLGPLPRRARPSGETAALLALVRTAPRPRGLGEQPWGRGRLGHGRVFSNSPLPPRFPPRACPRSAVSFPSLAPIPIPAVRRPSPAAN
jgi:hypothetical protein